MRSAQRRGGRRARRDTRRSRALCRPAMAKGGGKGENPKATAAKSRKAEQAAGKEAAAKAREEDQYWAEAGAGAKSKAQAKRDDQVGRAWPRAVCCRSGWCRGA